MEEELYRHQLKLALTRQEIAHLKRTPRLFVGGVILGIGMGLAIAAICF